jgi:type I restriction enzyme S subunit
MQIPQRTESMKPAWPTVRLGEVLAPVRREETVNAATSYALLGVRLAGQGPFLRETVLGAETSARTLFRVADGDFIYSRLFACRGAFGVIDARLDGHFVSSEFPTFVPIADRISVAYLRYWFLLPPVIASVNERCSGSTPLTRNRFKEASFLGLEIPLPPLDEQRRIFGRIEELSVEIETARRLREEAMEQGETLCRAILVSDFDSTPTPMRELVRLRVPDVAVVPDGEYQFAGVYCFGRGVFRGQKKTGMQFAYPRLTTLRAGDFVYPKLMAWEGALAVVPAECEGCVVSTEFPVFEVLENRVFHEVLDTYFRTPSVWPEIAGSSTGTNVRRRRLNPQDFLNYRLPLPSRATQERLRRVRAEVTALQVVQAETVVALDALLPSILDRAFKGEL